MLNNLITVLKSKSELDSFFKKLGILAMGKTFTTEQKNLINTAQALGAETISSLIAKSVLPEGLYESIFAKKYCSIEGATQYHVIPGVGSEKLVKGLANSIIDFLEPKALMGHKDSIPFFACSPNNKYIISGSKELVRWGGETGNSSLKIMPNSNKLIYCTDISPDGRYVVSALENLLVMRDVETGEKLKTFDGHTDTIYCVKFSPDGKKLISGGKDGKSILWDAETGKEKSNLEHNFCILSAVWSPDGKRFALGGHNGSLVLVKGKGNDYKKEKELHGFSSVYSVSFHPSGKKIALPYGNSAIILNIKNGYEEFVYLNPTQFPDQDSDFSCVKYSSSGGFIASGHNNGVVILWDVENWNKKKQAPPHVFIRGHLDRVNCLAFSPDSKYIISCSSDKSVMRYPLFYKLGKDTFNAIADEKFSIAEQNLLYRFYKAKMARMPLSLDPSDPDCDIYNNLNWIIKKLIISQFSSLPLMQDKELQKKINKK